MLKFGMLRGDVITVDVQHWTFWQMCQKSSTGLRKNSYYEY